MPKTCTKSSGRNHRKRHAERVKLLVVNFNPHHDKAGRFSSGSGGVGIGSKGKDASEFHPKDVADVSLPVDTDTNEFFYHAPRSDKELQSILDNGVKPGSLDKSWLSKDEIRDRGAGFVIVKVPRGKAVEGVDFVETGLTYREWTVVETIDVADIVGSRKMVIDNTGFRIREDHLAKAFLSGSVKPDELEGLPKAYKKWAHRTITNASPPPPTPRKTPPNPLKIDPSRTGGIRRKFEADVSNRMDTLATDIWDVIYKEDAFGLVDDPFAIHNFNPHHDKAGRFASGPGGKLLIGDNLGKLALTDDLPDNQKLNKGEIRTTVVDGKKYFAKPARFGEIEAQEREIAASKAMHEVGLGDYTPAVYRGEDEKGSPYLVSELLEGYTPLNDGGFVKSAQKAEEIPMETKQRLIFQDYMNGAWDRSSTNMMTKGPRVAMVDYEMAFQANSPDPMQHGLMQYVGTGTEYNFGGEKVIGRSLDGFSFDKKVIKQAADTEETLVKIAKEMNVNDTMKKGIVDGIKDRGKRLRAILKHDDVKKEHVAAINSLLTNASPKRWRFATTPDKLKLFKAWLQTRVAAGVLQAADETPWLSTYISSAYKAAAVRSYAEIVGARAGSTLGTEYQGGVESFLLSAFNSPEAREKIQLIFLRSYDQLKGMTEAMGQVMSRVLADGLAHGDGPYAIAQALVKQVKISKERARMIARTELIHAHAEGQLDSFERLGVAEVGVMAEWSTAGDSRVCSSCAPMEGVVFPVSKARGLIPRHPNCRCAFRPANIGEDTTGQQRGKSNIQAAIKKSLGRGGKKKSSWVGGDLIGNFNPHHDKAGRFSSGAGGGMMSADIGGGFGSSKTYTAIGKSTPIEEAEFENKSKELSSKLQVYHQEYANEGKQELSLRAKELADTLDRGDYDGATRLLSESDLRYEIPQTSTAIVDLKDSVYLAREFGSDWGTKPGTYTAHRSGGLDSPRGVFLSIDRKGAASYGPDVKSYEIELKNPLVAPRLEDAYATLTGKSVTDVVAQRQRASNVNDWWQKLDKKIATAAKKAGYDAVVYTKPAPPAIRELHVFDKNQLK